MKTLFATLALGSAFALVAQAQTATTTPVGYVTITCPANSDTIVGVPLKQPTVAAGALASAPSVNAGSATLTISSANFTASQFANTYYVKFTSGGSQGKYYAITANTTNTLTIDLNGDTLAAAQSDTLSVTKFWTLGELFDPSKSTTDPTTTGNAIVASTSTSFSGRRTQILIPDTVTAGTNLAPTATFYVYGGTWRRQGTSGTFESFQLWPDTYFIVRHNASVTSGTNFVSSGEVETANFQIPLATQTNSKQDNFIALLRPVNVRLRDLNLGGTTAFIESATTSFSTRRDELLIFDNTASALNKSPSATYYYSGSMWRRQGQTGDAGDDTIPAGSGIIIRKYPTTTGTTVFWNNTSSY